MIKGVIFDFGFTLFYFENPSIERYFNFLNNGLLKSIETLKRMQIWNENLTTEEFIRRFAKEQEIYFNKSKKTNVEFPTSFIFKNLLDSLDNEYLINNLDNLTEITYNELAELYHSCEENEWKPFKNTKATLDELSKRKLKIAILSNHPNHATIKNVLKKHNLLHYFNFVITSAKYGKRKPDPNIFFYTLEKLGLKKQAGSIIMCGDEYTDVSGAQKANLRSIFFDKKFKFSFEEENNMLNLTKIKDISEILNFIK